MQKDAHGCETRRVAPLDVIEVCRVALIAVRLDGEQQEVPVLTLQNVSTHHVSITALSPRTYVRAPNPKETTRNCTDSAHRSKYVHRPKTLSNTSSCGKMQNLAFHKR